MSQGQDNTQAGKREHLTVAERKTIERMMRSGANKGEIARALYRDKSTIKREVKRGSVVQRKRNRYESKKSESAEFIEQNVYYWDVGQRVYEEHRQRCGSKNKVIACKEMVAYVEGMILGEKKWSPDTAIGNAQTLNLYPGKMCCTKTFYNWIEDGLVKVKNIDLLLKVRRKPKSPRKERKRVLGKSIETRPAEVENRQVFGHWEGDGIVGKGHKGHLITLVERKSGMGLLFNAFDREKQRIVDIVDGLKERYAEQFSAIFKTLTLDNGAEFADSQGLEKDKEMQVFYAHPYSSFERGTNENWNGIVRRFIPKGSSFDDLTLSDIQRINHYINTMPRKRFGYKTPLDLWQLELDGILAAQPTG